MSGQPANLKLPPGVDWHDLCEHRRGEVLDMMRESFAHPFAYGNSGSIRDLKCEKCMANESRKENTSS